MAFNPKEVAQITVGGMVYKDWESVHVHLAEGESNNTYKFTCSEGAPLAKNWAAIRIKPGDHCTITLGGELAISGYVEKRSVAYTATQHGIEISGVSYTKATVDGSVVHETGEFRKKPFQAIAQQILQPFGLLFRPLTPISQKIFERASVPPGESAWHFLETLARQRGITLGTDVQGNMTGRTKYTGGGDMLIEGKNILEGREEMSGAKGDGPDQGLGQDFGDDKKFGAKSAHDPAARSTSRNRFGRGVHAVNTHLAERPGDKDDMATRAKYESEKRGEEKLQVTIVVQGWHKPSGGLWKPGEKVHVRSPMLILDEALNLKSATFTQDSRSGTRTTLELSNEDDEEDKGTGRTFESTNKGPPPPASPPPPPPGKLT